ncbi:MAG: T9SS type A sorting domain-containing protein, partial [Bacteroidota bacterium]
PQTGSYAGSLTWEAEYYTGSANDFSSIENDVTSMMAIETNVDTDEQVENVNESEYWRVDSGGGSATLESIAIDISDLGVTNDDINDQLLQVMVWDEAGGEWDHLGGITAGTPTAASVSSAVSLNFSERIITSGIENNTILPVELLYFQGEVLDNVIALEWATATELNNDYFDVERSKDGIDFVAIGRVEGNGNTSELISYNFLDSQPNPGNNYYRLKQVDYDGVESFYEIIQLFNDYFQKNMEATIYPNPATSDNIRLRVLSGDDHTPVSIRIIDLNGNIYFEEIIEASLNFEQKLESSRSIPGGLYFMIITQGKQSIKEKLIVK